MQGREESSVTQAWASMSGYILLIFYEPQLSQDFLQAMLFLIIELTWMGAVGTSNVAGGTSGVASAKSFVVNFLDKKFAGSS